MMCMEDYDTQSGLTAYAEGGFDFNRRSILAVTKLDGQAPGSRCVADRLDAVDQERAAEVR